MFYDAVRAVSLAVTYVQSEMQYRMHFIHSFNCSR